MTPTSPQSAPQGPILRRAVIEVEYDPHGAEPTSIDWDYHLRMGDIDAHSAIVRSDEEQP